MSDRNLVSKISGSAAIVSALLFIVSLKAPGPLANVLTAAWNVLLLPAAVMLWRWLRPKSGWLRPRSSWLARKSGLVDGASAAGIAATVLWAAAPVTGWWQLEAVWIGLGMLWWLGLGIGPALRREWKWFGWATLILGIAAALDLIVTLVAAANTDWFFLGAVKLPLSMLWSMWLGVLLVTRPVEVGEGRGDSWSGG